MSRTLRFIVVILIMLVSACGDTYFPKPRGYFRIDFPGKDYRKFDTTFPYTFEYPAYTKIFPDTSTFTEPYWINIVYPLFHAQLHISYKVIRGDLKDYLEDSRTLVNKHIPKASSISQREYADPANKVYGLVYNIKGSEAASACQFYLTDSTGNFLRGALYFDLVPNNDSLAPVIEFLEADIEHMISTFRWKKAGH